MAASDTDAILQSYKTRIRELAQAVAGVEGSQAEAIYNDLLCTVKSSMTDQGPTMPQFGGRLSLIREELLPTIVRKWQHMKFQRLYLKNAKTLSSLQ